MQAKKNFSTIISQLRSNGTRKKVALVCPNDSHTEYVINRALEEGIADFILVTGGTRAEFIDVLSENIPDTSK